MSTPALPRTEASSTQPTRLPALDPRSLGRPVHRLPRVAEALREALQRRLCQPWNRRYRAHYELQALTLKPLDPAALGEAGRWLRAPGTPDGPGPLACRLERALVLGLMARRLGLPLEPARPDTIQATPPTATEERLHQQLARQLCTLSLQLLEQARTDQLGGADLPPATELGALTPASQPGLGADAWLMQLTIAQDPLDDAPLQVLLALDSGYITPLLHQLAQAARAARPPSAPTQPLARRLNLTVQARLLEQPIALGDLLDLQPGALIPVRLADATVLVDNSPLMRAAVAEHQGKLCLTSFQDLE